MEGGFQRSLQLFAINGYCVFEDDVCVDLSCVLDGRTNYASITFSGFFAGPYVDRPKVIDKGPDYVVGLILGFYARVRCPLVLAPFRGAIVKV